MSAPLLQLLPDCPTSLPTRLHTLLLLISLKTKTKAKQENQNNPKKKKTSKTKKKKMSKQNTPKRNKNTKTSMGSILCWQLLDMGPDVRLIKPASLH